LLAEPEKLLGHDRTEFVTTGVVRQVPTAPVPQVAGPRVLATDGQGLPENVVFLCHTTRRDATG
jgi:hypothetical protein